MSPTVNDAGDERAVDLREAARMASVMLRDSALDTESDAFGSVRDPHYLLSTPPIGIRRRGSEFGRLRPTDFVQTTDIELAQIPSGLAKAESDVASLASRTDKAPPKVTVPDVELAPGPSLPQSAAVSTLDEPDSMSTAPILTAAEKRAQHRWSRIHFAAFCWCFYLVGWNDGSTGPLLPTIQRHHNVGFVGLVRE